MSTDLTTAAQNAVKEFSALLTAIKNNNGVNPGAVDGLVTRGERMVSDLKTAIESADKAENPNPQNPVTVSISPTSATLAPGATQQFTAKVEGSENTAVIWTASSGPNIDPSGLYTAPSTPGTYKVAATSQADMKKTALASVTISA